MKYIMFAIRSSIFIAGNFVKRIFDILASALGLLATFPIILTAMFLVWKHDRHSPFYIAPRVGRGGRLFNMIKFRSMVINADSSEVDSTGSNDSRITPIGHLIRRYKLDELTQLLNVMIGDMSLVGPRPNVTRETDLYTLEERKLLSVRPGITDFASIVFSDEGDILKDKANPDIAYNQLIRPGKGRLGLFYLSNQSFWLDIRLCWLTVVALFSRPRALAGVKSLLRSLGAPSDLIEIASREKPLVPSPPVGGDYIVEARSGNAIVVTQVNPPKV
jgi:lipopolysaccharide/colanic/teichoic acid biosynthesis glycosyltransferase